MGAAGEHLLGCQIQNSSNIPCMAMTFSVSAKRLKFTDDFINLVSGFNWILCWSYLNVSAWILHWNVRHNDVIFNA